MGGLPFPMSEVFGGAKAAIIGQTEPKDKHLALRVLSGVKSPENEKK